MNWRDMVWTLGPNGWHSRSVGARDQERRALVNQWLRGELTFHQVACISRDKALSELECAEAQ
jgi:hypothetical protein